MITTLTGVNAYQLGAELRRIVGAFVDEYTDMGLEKFDGQELDPKRVPSILQALPFLASKRMVVLRNPSAQKAVQEQLEKLIDDISESTDVVIVEPTMDKRTSYYKTLKKKTDFREFPELDEGSLERWLVTEAKQKGGLLSSGDAHYLVRRVGINQSLLANELDKLINYSPSITRATIDEMTDPTPQSSVFDLLDATLAGDKQKVVQLYQEQRQQKVEPQAIMGMIAWQLHILALVKTAGGRNDQVIASEAKVNPYVVRKTAQAARRTSAEQLKDLVAYALRLDIRLKSEPIDADDALLEFLLSSAP